MKFRRPSSSQHILPVIAMPSKISNSTKEAIIAVLIITGVVLYLYIFHFLLGMTWMIYVLVIAALAMMIIRKLVSLRRKRASVTAGTA